jgi:chromosome segregation ATPase
MVRAGVYDQIKRAFQDLVAPELHAMRSDMRLLDQKIDSVDARLSAKIDGVDGRLTAKIDALDQKIDGVDARLTTKMDALDRKIDDLDSRLTTRFDSLRAEMGSLKGERLAEIRRVDVRIDGVDRELRTAIDIRERLAALEARRVP